MTKSCSAGKGGLRRKRPSLTSVSLQSYPRNGGVVLNPGSNVRLIGLQSPTTRSLNGQRGTCQRWDAIAGRMHVKLNTGEVKAFRPENLFDVNASKPKTPGAQAERITRIFRKYDTNGDGVIDIQELEGFLKALGLNVGCVQSFVRAVDKDGDGEIQYEEFVEWVLAEDPKLPDLLLPDGDSDLSSRPSTAGLARAEDEADGEAPMGKQASGKEGGQASGKDVGRAASSEQGSLLGTSGALAVSAAIDSDSCSQSDEEEWSGGKALKHEDLVRICGKLPGKWPENGVTIVNNMRSRFPDYPVKDIVRAMRENSFHGGEVMQAIRRTGSTELRVVRPVEVRFGKSGRNAFPALYQVRRTGDEVQVYEQKDGREMNFDDLVKGRIQSVGTVKPGDRFRVLEVRRDHDRHIHFARIYFGTKAEKRHWVDLGLDVGRTQFMTANQGTDLHFTHAERLEPS